MTRHNFTQTTKKTALARSGGTCEAAGLRYGLPTGTRCTTPIAFGSVQFDHYPRGAHDPHPDTRSVDNCVACCPAHNQYAANHTDKQREWKIKDVRRKHGIDPDERKKSPPIRSRGFQQGHRPIQSKPFPQRAKK